MQMNHVVGIGLILAGASLVIVSNFLFFAVIGEINARLPPNEKAISMFFVRVSIEKIYRKHRELFPESRKLLATNIVGAFGMILGFVGFAIGTEW